MNTPDYSSAGRREENEDGSAQELKDQLEGHPSWEKIANVHREASENRLKIIKNLERENKLLRDTKEDLQKRIDGLEEESELDIDHDHNAYGFLP